MDHDLLMKAYEASCQGKSYAIATIVESTIKGTPRKAGAKMIVFQDGTLWGTIGGGRNEKAAQKECLKAIRHKRSKIATYDYFGKEGQSICGGQIKVFIEPVIPQKHFIICGGGHIALPLSVLAKMLNLKVSIVDNRETFANKKRFPHVDGIWRGDYVKELSKLTINQDTFIMIVTQGNEHDFQCLKTVINSTAGYIGVISSKPKRIKFFRRLKSMGIEEKFLRKIDIPAGIDIGAQTPEEIAVSIAARLIQVKNKEMIGTDKFKEKMGALLL